MLHQEVPFKVSTIVIAQFRSRLCFLPFRASFKTPEVACLQTRRNQNCINTQRAFHQRQQGPAVQDTCNRVSSLAKKTPTKKDIVTLFVWRVYMLPPARKYVAVADQIKTSKLHLSREGSNAGAHNKHISGLIRTEHPLAEW